MIISLVKTCRIVSQDNGQCVTLEQAAGVQVTRGDRQSAGEHTTTARALRQQHMGLRD